MGNLRRHQAVTAKVEQIDHRPSTSEVTSPIEYVDLLRKLYEEKRKQEADDRIIDTKEAKPTKRKKKVKPNPRKDESNK